MPGGKGKFITGRGNNMNHLPETPQCPRCGSKKHVIRESIEQVGNEPIFQTLLCNFCHYEWFDEVKNSDGIQLFGMYVKHGKWNKMSESIGYVCSCCGKEMYCCSVKEPENLPKYCSNCGAKMDLK